MKKTILPSLLSIIGIIGVIILFLFHFMASDKVAYIDNNKLMEKYKGMEEARKVFEQKAKLWQGNVDTLASEIEHGMKQYEKDRASGMTDKEKKLTEQLLNNKQQQFLQYRDAMQKKAKEEENKITMDVLSKLNSFVKVYGKQKKYKIIFGATSVGNIVYADDVLNITDEIIEVVNKEYTRK